MFPIDTGNKLPNSFRDEIVPLLIIIDELSLSIQNLQSRVDRIVALCSSDRMQEIIRIIDNVDERVWEILM
jgi:hypothetical protein